MIHAFSHPRTPHFPSPLPFHFKHPNSSLSISPMTTPMARPTKNHQISDAVILMIPIYMMYLKTVCRSAFLTFSTEETDEKILIRSHVPFTSKTQLHADSFREIASF
jgi:hypothetical protein